MEKKIYEQSSELLEDFTFKCIENHFSPPKDALSIINNEKRQKDPVLQKEINELIIANNYIELRNKINKEEITLLQIPEEITYIPDFAFFQCKSLIKVTTSSNLKSIGNYAFFWM